MTAFGTALKTAIKSGTGRLSADAAQEAAGEAGEAAGRAAARGGAHAAEKGAAHAAASGAKSNLPKAPTGKAFRDRARAESREALEGDLGLKPGDRAQDAVRSKPVTPGFGDNAFREEMGNVRNKMRPSGDYVSPKRLETDRTAMKDWKPGSH